MRIELNKYLKEIGIDENYWLFDKTNQENDSRYRLNEDGFVDAEFFNLDTTLAIILYSYLSYFQENCLYGTPMGMETHQWEKIVAKMVEAFKLMLEEPDFPYDKTQSKNKQKKINYGLRLFIKYFNCLWY